MPTSSSRPRTCTTAWTSVPPSGIGIVDANAAGRLFSIEKVADEIVGMGDDLSAWAGERNDGFFLRTDAAVVPSLGAVSTWATGQSYDQAAVNTFLQRADYYLVAHAHATGHTVVTHEVPSSSVRKIKIPDACIGTNVAFMTPYQMLRRERARFVLGRDG